MRSFPPYPARPHGGSGQARIKIDGRHRYLGVHGSPESWAEYGRLLDLWRRGQLPDRSGQLDCPDLRFVGDLVARYVVHARLKHAGRRQLDNVLDALAPLVPLVGRLPWRDLRKGVLRQALLDAATGRWLSEEEAAKRRATGRKLTWSRRYANACLGHWLRALAWCEGEELVPGGTFAALRTVERLREGEAEERAPVMPPVEDHVWAALPCMHAVPRALCEVLALTGARPGELFQLTPSGLNRSGEVEIARGYRVQLGATWAYVPERHKTAHKGQLRVVLFGPQSQRVLTPLLNGRPGDRPIFCPREASNRPEGQRSPGERYDRHSIGQAIERACARAGVPRWCAYQLRHLAATNLVRDFGWEVARVVLGHRKVETTQIYAVSNLAAAVEAIGKAG